MSFNQLAPRSSWRQNGKATPIGASGLVVWLRLCEMQSRLRPTIAVRVQSRMRLRHLTFLDLLTSSKCQASAADKCGTKYNWQMASSGLSDHTKALLPCDLFVLCKDRRCDLLPCKLLHCWPVSAREGYQILAITAARTGAY